MSIRISTGSLIALGIGAGDVAAIAGLSKRFGNWWSASSGDDEFLELLDEDEFDILRRKGLIDIQAFKKRWRKEIRLLANGEPLVFKDEDAEKVSEPLRRFTAAMVCVVTALDTFTTSATSRFILRRVLLELLRTTERGEDVLATQYSTRLSSWRSLSCLRGFSHEADKVRRQLLEHDLIMPGFMPIEDSKIMIDFLVWMLAGSTETLTTPSSDIAGLAMCISHLGIDILSVRDFGFKSRNTPCYVIYSKDSVIAQDYKENHWGVLGRDMSSTVSLLHPEESIACFPTSLDTHNRCRQAWKAGQRAADHVLDASRWSDDLRYCFVDQGTPPERVRAEIQEMASNLAFVMNQELLEQLNTCLGRESAATLAWLNLLTSDVIYSRDPKREISDPEFTDSQLVDTFCVFQSFFTGYYYKALLRLVDTRSLKVQTVEGQWGFRSAYLLTHMRFNFWKNGIGKDSRRDSVSRQSIIEALSMMLLNREVRLTSDSNTEEDRKGDWCVGVIARRSLLTNSLVSGCYHPGEIGRFVLLDVDVGGVPRDYDGIVRPVGIENVEDYLQPKEVPPAESAVGANLTESSPPEDATLHIEPDWDGNPDQLVICVRYRGRRFTTFSPTVVDAYFICSYIPPIDEPRPEPLARGFQVTVSQLISAHEAPSLSIYDSIDPPSLIQVYDMPVWRYTMVSLYANWCHLALASNCINTAARTH